MPESFELPTYDQTYAFVETLRNMYLSERQKGKKNEEILITLSENINT